MKRGFIGEKRRRDRLFRSQPFGIQSILFITALVIAQVAISTLRSSCLVLNEIG